jgi:hypothetical protein
VSGVYDASASSRGKSAGAAARDFVARSCKDLSTSGGGILIRISSSFWDLSRVPTSALTSPPPVGSWQPGHLGHSGLRGAWHLAHSAVKPAAERSASIRALSLAAMAAAPSEIISASVHHQQSESSTRPLDDKSFAEEFKLRGVQSPRRRGRRT